MSMLLGRALKNFLKLAWMVCSKPGLLDGYTLGYGCQVASDVHASKCAHLDINNMDIVYHTSAWYFNVLHLSHLNRTFGLKRCCC